MHGGLFYFNRNRATAANTFFNNRAGIRRPVFHRDEYGASLGGPILKNKLFYFGSFEGFCLARAGNITTQMPTGALRQGDFSALPPISDPFNGGVPFPNNRIPNDRIASVPKGLNRFFSESNLPGTPPAWLGNNYTAHVPVFEPFDRYSARIDYLLTGRSKISGRFFRSANGPLNPSGVFSPAGSLAPESRNSATGTASATRE